MADPTTELREVLALSARFKAWECAGDELRCDDGNGCECEMAGNLCPDAPGGALAFIDKHGPALLSALEDARRLDWLSDRDQHIGNVMLPTHIVEANVHSLRAAIDAATAEGEAQ